MQNTSTKLLQLDQIAARKEHNAIAQMIAALPDSFAAWIECYINLTVIGVRNDEIADKIILHLSRFASCGVFLLWRRLCAVWHKAWGCPPCRTMSLLAFAVPSGEVVLPHKIQSNGKKRSVNDPSRNVGDLLHKPSNLWLVKKGTDCFWH